jgi:hypothetical protein
MKIVNPIEVTEAILAASDVALTDYTVWTAGSYGAGSKRRYGLSAYEALTTTTDQPDVGAAAAVPTWLRLGYVNRWRMFRDGSDSLTTNTGAITVTLDFAAVVTTVALLGLVADTVHLVATDTIEGVVYDETFTLTDISAPDWWEYFFTTYSSLDTALFENIPPYPDAVLALTISRTNPLDTASCGRVVAGVIAELGVTNYGTDVGILDYSIKERDEFGNLQIVQRRTVKRVGYDVTLESSLVDYVQRALAKVSATPALFIGDTLYASTVVFGLYRDFTINLLDLKTSSATIEVEGF